MNMQNRRNQIAGMYWDLKNDYDQMELQDIYYDVGLMIGLCICLNKPNLSDKIYVRFMGSK